MQRQVAPFAPRNQWYVAAWSSEVTRQPMERWILNEPVALYRTESGRAVAVEGRCPHRHFPLGASRTVGDNIECGYHGITFGPDGACVRIPSQARIPSACRVKSYALAERWKWIWIWPGDPELADESKIPDHLEMGLTDPDYDIHDGCYYYIPGRYSLMHDNLVDTTHINHLHRDTIAAIELDDKPPVVERAENWVSSHVEFEDVECPAYFADLIGYQGRVNRRFGVTFHFPSIHAGSNVFTVPGKRGNAPLHVSLTYHAFTPATRASTHHFFAGGCTRHPGAEPDHYKKVVTGADVILREDFEAYRRIEQMLSNLEEAPREPFFLESDRPAALIRQMFKKALDAECLGHAGPESQ